ncbi:alanine-zipper protein [Rhodospirillum sp. A1_3_36]|uniref:alanine-zipper protein n=1 Tax=Rhodospirillum sp. A1_3_36 TaxID=3391666 RepID=UPI0039A4AAFA
MMRILISAVSVVAFGGYVCAPKFLSQDLIDRLDATALGILVLAVFPWLAQFVKEFEAFGVKAKMQEVEKKADSAIEDAQEARSAAAEARKAAENANLAASNASDAAQRARELAEELFNLKNNSNSKTLPSENLSNEALKDLASEYIKTRNSMKPGTLRTAKMTEIFSRMQQAAQLLGKGSVDVSEWLESSPGLQLAAISYLRAFPDEIIPGKLMSVIDRQHQPFIQYWALRALNNFADASGTFPPNDMRWLRSIENHFKVGTDRHDQVKRILRKLDA